MPNDSNETKKNGLTWNRSEWQELAKIAANLGNITSTTKPEIKNVSPEDMTTLDTSTAQPLTSALINDNVKQIIAKEIHARLFRRMSLPKIYMGCVLVHPKSGPILVDGPITKLHDPKQGRNLTDDGSDLMVTIPYVRSDTVFTPPPDLTNWQQMTLFFDDFRIVSVILMDHVLEPIPNDPHIEGSNLLAWVMKKLQVNKALLKPRKAYLDLKITQEIHHTDAEWFRARVNLGYMKEMEKLLNSQQFVKDESVFLRRNTMNHKEVEASFENMNKIVGPEGPKADYFYRSAGVRTHYGVFLKCVDLLFKHGLEPDYSSGFLKSKQSKKGHIIFSAESDKEQWFDLIYNNRGWRQKWHLCLWNPRMEDAAEIYILSDITRAEPKDMIFERDRDALDPLPMYQGGPLPAPYVRANYCRISADNDYDSNWFKIVAQFQGKRDSLIYRG